MPLLPLPNCQRTKPQNPSAFQRQLCGTNPSGLKQARSKSELLQTTHSAPQPDTQHIPTRDMLTNFTQSRKEVFDFRATKVIDQQDVPHHSRCLATPTFGFGFFRHLRARGRMLASRV